MRRTLPIALQAAIIGIGCVSSAIAASNPQSSAAKDNICIWTPEMRSGYYTVIDDQHLVIEGAGKKYFLVTLFTKCFDLDTTLQLGFKSRADQLCSGDSIITGRDRCGIWTIEPVPSSDAAKALVDSRKSQKQ